MIKKAICSLLLAAVCILSFAQMPRIPQRLALVEIDSEIAGTMEHLEVFNMPENGVNQLIAEAGILDRHNKFVEVNHFYDTLGLSDIKFGNDFGWGAVECDRAPSLGVEITYDVQEIDGEQVAVGILDYEVGMSHVAFGDYFQDALR